MGDASAYIENHTRGGMRLPKGGYDSLGNRIRESCVFLGNHISGGMRFPIGSRIRGECVFPLHREIVV